MGNLKPSFFAVVGLLLADIGVLSLLIASGGMSLGVFLLMGSAIVFSSGTTWLISKEDGRVHFQGAWKAVFVLLFCSGIFLVLQKSGLQLQIAPENLSEVGNILASRYLVGGWILSVVMLMVFVAVGTVAMRKEKS